MPLLHTGFLCGLPKWFFFREKGSSAYRFGSLYSNVGALLCLWAGELGEVPIAIGLPDVVPPTPKSAVLELAGQKYLLLDYVSLRENLFVYMW